MITAAAPTLGQAPYWYLTRSTGIVSFVLLTLAMAFGVAATQRSLASPAWPRFATQDLHRSISFLGLALLLVHILTTLLDGFVSISWLAFVVPFTSSYRTLWVGLGTLAFDLLLLLTVSSLLRTHLSAALWRGLHWTAYAMWPLSLLHFLNTGTDKALGLWIGWSGAMVVALAGAVRLLSREGGPRPLRSIVR